MTAEERKEIQESLDRLDAINMELKEKLESLGAEIDASRARLKEMRERSQSRNRCEQ